MERYAAKNGFQQLWEQCKGFIRKEACRWARAFENRPDIDADDLTQSGYFALLDAVQRFDPARGNFISVLAMTLKLAFTDACGIRTQQQRQYPAPAAQVDPARARARINKISKQHRVHAQSEMLRLLKARPALP